MDVRLSKSKEEWVTAYLTIWQSFLGLTERELEVTSLIALRYLSLEESVKEPALLAELLLSPTAKLHIRNTIPTTDGQALSANGLQNYLAALRDKGVLLPLAGKLILNPKLIPQKNITFHFTVTE